MRGGATGGRDLVLVVKRVCLPCMDGVILEACEDGIGHWLEEHLKEKIVKQTLYFLYE